MIATVLASRPAFAEANDSKAAAKARLERGADLLVNHAYSRALIEFEDAYHVFPSPKIFFDIGLANVGLDRNPEALRAFQRFLVEATDASPDAIARAKAQVEALLPRVAIVDVTCQRAGLEIVIDDRSVGRAPLAGPVYLDPGTHLLVAKENEGTPPIVKSFDVVGGTKVDIDVAPVAVAAGATLPSSPASDGQPTLVDKPGPGSPEAATTGEDSIYRKPWFWAAAAGAAAAAGLTLLLTVGRSTNDPTASLGHKDLPASP